MKTKRIFKRFLGVMMLVFILGYLAAAPPWAQADIPRYINYQGKLTDAEDNPVTGDVSVTLRIYDAETGGTALWTEAQTVTVTRGIFSMLLGSTTALDDLAFDAPYWYSVEVEADGEMTPRQRLTTVAYSLNAAKLGGYEASDYLRVDASEGTTTGITVSGGLITAGAGEDITLDPTGYGDIVMQLDDTSGEEEISHSFKIIGGELNWFVVNSDTGNVTISQSLTVGGTIYGDIASTGGDSTFSSITVTGASDLQGNLDVGGNADITGNLDVTGNSDVTGTLTATGATTLSSALDMNSNIDLDYSGTSAALNVAQAGTGTAATFTGGEVVIGAATANTYAVSTGELYVQGDLEVDGTIYGDLTGTGTTTLGDTTLDSLVVVGTSDLRGDVSDTTGVFTVADNVGITADALTSGGTDDYALNITQTLNDTGAAGGSDVYRGIKLDVTETDTTGWDNVYLMDLQVDGDSKFNVDNTGRVTVATPTAGGHAVTKTYVDTRTWSTAGGWTENLATTDVYVTDTDDNVAIGIATAGAYKLNVSGATNTTNLYIGGTQVTASATELNLIDGYIGSTANLNTLTNASNADALHTHTAAGVSTNVISSVDGVSNDGGDIDLVASTNIIIVSDDDANTITLSSTQVTENEAEAYIFDADAETILGNWDNTASPWADNEVADALTIDGGTIGGVTPAAGTFTILKADTLLDVDNDMDIDFATAGEQITIDSTDVATAGLMVINDLRAGTNNDAVGEAAVSIYADGTYALYVEDGDTLIGDDQLLILGDDRDVSISYDETSTDRLIIDGKYGGAFHNLAWNGDFESWGQGVADTAPDAWTKGTGATVDRDTSPKINTYVAKVTSDGTGGRIMSQEIPAVDLKASTTYAISVWAKATDGDTAKLDITGESGTFTAQTTTATTWTLLSGTFATDSTPAAVTVQLIADGASDIVYFDGAMIQEGKMISQFAPRYIHDTGAQSIYGDLTLYNTTVGAGGTLTIEGTIDITGTQSLDGSQVVDIDNDEAFLVRKDGDAGDVLLVDTNVRNVEIGEDAASKDAYLIIHGTDSAGLEVRAGDTSTDTLKLYHDDTDATIISGAGDIILTPADKVRIGDDKILTLGNDEDAQLVFTSATPALDITTTAGDANITLTPNGTGQVTLTGTDTVNGEAFLNVTNTMADSGTNAVYVAQFTHAGSSTDGAVMNITTGSKTIALTADGDVDVTGGDVEIDTSGTDVTLDTIDQTSAVDSLAIAVDSGQVGGGAASDSDGVLKLGVNEGDYQYIWYDTDAGTDLAGAFVFSDQAVIPTSSPAYLNFGMDFDSDTKKYGSYYAVKVDPDPDGDGDATDVQTFSVVNIPTPGANFADTEQPLFDISSDGSFNIYDPSVGEAIFQIEAGGVLAHDFRNLVKNGSFEAFSGFEDFIGYDTDYSETVYTEAEFATYGMKGGWDDFAPDEWEWVAGGASQHSPELFKTGGGGVFITDFYAGKSSIALCEKSNIGTPYVLSSIEPSAPLDAAVKQVITDLEPNTWYSIAAASMVYGTNTIAIVDITGDYRPTINLTTAITTTGALDSIAVSSTANFAAGGTIKIGNELLSYTGKTDTSLTGITRGAGLTTAATHTTGTDNVQMAFKRLASTSSFFEYKKSSFKTDSVGSDITIYLICQQTTGADEFDLARFDAVQMVKGKTVPKYAPTSIVDTGDQSIYGTLHLGRSASGQGGILAVDQYIRTRGIDFFDDDPGISGTAGGGGYVGQYYELVNTTDGVTISSNSPGNVMMDTSGNYIKPNNKKFQVWVQGNYTNPTDGTIKYRYAECTDPMADTYGLFNDWSSTVSIPVTANQDIILDFGVIVKFSEAWDTAKFKGGDRWEFKAYGAAQEEDMYDSFHKDASYVPSGARIFRDPETGELTFEDEKAGKVKLSDIISQSSAGYISPPVRDPVNQSTTNITATGDLNSTIVTTGKTFVVDVESSDGVPTKFGWRTQYDYYDTATTTYEHYGNWGVTITKGSAQPLVDATNGDIGISITFPTGCTLYNYDRWTFYASPGSAADVGVHTHAGSNQGGTLGAPGTTSASFIVGTGTDPASSDVTLQFGGGGSADKYMKWKTASPSRFEVSSDMHVNGTFSATNLSGTIDGGGTNSGTFTANSDLTSGTEPVDATGFVIEGYSGDVGLLYNTTSNYLNITGPTVFTGVNIPSGTKYKIGGTDLNATHIGASAPGHSHTLADVTDEGALASLSAVTGGTAGTITDGTIVDADLASGSFSSITGVGTLGSLNVTGNVGIGTTLPTALLNVSAAAGSPGAIDLSTRELTVVDGDVLGKIEFDAPLESSTTDAILVGAAIEAVAEGEFTTTNNATELVFKTGASEAATQKMVITSAGSIGVGTAAPAALLDVQGVIQAGSSNIDLVTTTGLLKHEAGGIEANISAVTTGGILAGTGSGTMGIVVVGDEDQVLTVQSNDTLAWETPAAIYADADAVSAVEAETTLEFDAATTISTAVGALSLAPVAGSNLNITTSGAGNVAINTSQLVVDSDTGNIGIGTTTPAAALTVGNNAFKVTSDGAVTAGTWTGTEIADANVSNTLTASIFKDANSTSNAIDLATTEAAGTLPVSKGGTNITTYATGNMLYSSATNVLSALAGNTTATKKFLTQTGTGSASVAPGWGTIADADIPATIARQSYVDAGIAGLSWKEAVLDDIQYVKAGAPTGTNAADEQKCLDITNKKIYTYDSDTPSWGSGAAMSDGDRYIFKTSGSDTGGSSGTYTANKNLYELEGSTLTTITPADGDAVFVEDVNTGFVYTGSAWTPFTGATAYSWGGGLSATGTTIAVNAGTGIQISGDTVAVKLKTTPGLEVDANGLALADSVAGTGLSISNKILSATDSSATNEINTVTDGANTTTGLALTMSGAGISTASVSGNTITITSTEVDGSTTNEINTVSADSGGVTTGLAVTLAGGTNASTVRSADIVTINVDDAFIKNNADDITSGTLTIQSTTPKDLIIDNSTVAADADSGYITLRGNDYTATTNTELDMSMFLDVTTTSDYKLSIKNDGKTAEIASLDESGNLQIDGGITLGSTALSETNLIDMTDGGETSLHIHAASAPSVHASTHHSGGADEVYWASLERTSGSATTISSEIDTDISTHAAVTATHGVSGAIVGTTDTQELTNKTITTVANGFIVGTTQLVAASGNIGIGTATPTRLLDVNGALITTSLEVRGASPATITFGSGATARALQFDPDSGEFEFSGGKLKQSFQNLVRNGSFESYRPGAWENHNTTWGTDMDIITDSTAAKFETRYLRILDSNNASAKGMRYRIAMPDRLK